MVALLDVAKAKPTGRELISWGGKSIAVDCVGDFSPEYSAELTDHVVEDGSNVNDHKIFAPVQLTFEVSQTEHPIDDFAYEKTEVRMSVPPVRTQVLSPFLLAGTAIRGALGLFSEGAEKFVGYVTSNPVQRGNALFEEFLALYQSEDLAIVTFKGRAYPNMSLIGLKLLHSSSHVGLTKFQLAFKELRTVDIAAAGGGVLPDPADLRAKPPVEQGIKSPEKVAEEAKNISAIQYLRGHR
jgi:hypothetical protein